MNRRGHVRLIVGVVTLVAGFAGTLVKVVSAEAPDRIAPVSWSGWYSVVISTISCAGLWLVFGPLAKERLRAFLELPETLLLLKKIFCDVILEKDQVQLKLKALMEKLFSKRIQESVEMWEEIDQVQEDYRSLSQTMKESVMPSLSRIEENQRLFAKSIADQFSHAAQVNQQAIESVKQTMQGKFDDLGGRRHLPRK